jgi:hypothetical protein
MDAPPTDRSPATTGNVAPVSVERVREIAHDLALAHDQHAATLAPSDEAGKAAAVRLGEISTGLLSAFPASAAP